MFRFLKSAIQIFLNPRRMKKKKEKTTISKYLKVDLTCTDWVEQQYPCLQ